MKKGKSIKKLSYLKQAFLSQNKKMSKRNLPSLPHHSTCRTVNQFHISRMVWCKYTYPEPPWSLNSVTLLSGDRDKMAHANELTKVMLYASKTGSQTSSEWFRESKKWWSSEVAGIWKHTVLNISPWKYVCVLVYWPGSDTTCFFIVKGDLGNSYGEIVPLL